MICWERLKKCTAKNERILVTTLTKKMAEDLTDYLKEMGIKVRYLHSDIVTIERAEIIRELRSGVFDVLVGINLLREGLDMPEVSLVAILDADKEGFLRSDTSLVQTIGRAARHINGRVIMYADRITGSMDRAIKETDRRRTIQATYNEQNNIIPQSIKKEVRNLIELTKIDEGQGTGKKKSARIEEMPTSREDLFIQIEETERQMRRAAKNLEFEEAALFRDRLGELRQRWSDMHEASKSRIKTSSAPKRKRRTKPKD